MHATRKNGVPLFGEALHHIEVIVPTTHPWICSIAVSLNIRAQRRYVEGIGQAPDVDFYSEPPNHPRSPDKCALTISCRRRRRAVVDSEDRERIVSVIMKLGLVYQI